MDESATVPLAAVKPRRRWLRFSLRTMLLIVALLCVWLGVICNRANRQKRVVEAITKSGGEVFYDFQVDKDGSGFRVDAPPPGPAWLRNLIGNDYFFTVRRLYIVGDQKAVGDDTFSALSDLPQLTNLILRGPSVTDSAMAKVKGLTQLQVLWVSKSSVTEAGWESIAHLTKLKVLHLRDRNVSNSTLSNITSLTDLTELELVNTEVTDAGLKHLDGLPRLEKLDLEFSDKITDSGLQFFERLPRSLPWLGLLDIQNTAVTKAGVDELKRSVPTLQVFGP